MSYVPLVEQARLHSAPFGRVDKGPSKVRDAQRSPPLHVMREMLHLDVLLRRVVDLRGGYQIGVVNANVTAVIALRYL